MELDRLKILADKFWSGDCSEQEEAQLREYFRWSENEVPEELTELKEYLAMFNSDSSGLGLDFDQKVISAVKPKSNYNRKFYFSSIAASIVFLIGLFFFTNNNEEPSNLLTQTEDTYEDPEQALLEVKRALMMVSGGMNKGKKYSVELAKFNETKTQIQNQD